MDHHGEGHVGEPGGVGRVGFHVGAEIDVVCVGGRVGFEPAGLHHWLRSAVHGCLDIEEADGKPEASAEFTFKGSDVEGRVREMEREGLSDAKGHAEHRPHSTALVLRAQCDLGRGGSVESG